MKTEPDVFSLDDLRRGPNQCTGWEGVRNYQARNFMRDDMHIGDIVLFYHSRVEPIGIVGLARVVKEAFPDTSAMDPASDYYDPKATQERNPWVAVGVQFVEAFPRTIGLAELRNTPGLEAMLVIRRGMRLSIQPVTADEFLVITQLAKRKIAVSA